MRNFIKETLEVYRCAPFVPLFNDSLNMSYRHVLASAFAKSKIRVRKIRVEYFVEYHIHALTHIRSITTGIPNFLNLEVPGFVISTLRTGLNRYLPVFSFSWRISKSSTSRASKSCTVILSMPAVPAFFLTFCNAIYSRPCSYTSSITFTCFIHFLCHFSSVLDCRDALASRASTDSLLTSQILFCSVSIRFVLSLFGLLVISASLFRLVYSVAAVFRPRLPMCQRRYRHIQISRRLWYMLYWMYVNLHKWRVLHILPCFLHRVLPDRQGFILRSVTRLLRP